MDLHNLAIDSMTVLVPHDCFLKMPEGIFDEVIEVNSDTSEILNTYTKNIHSNRFGITLRANLFHIIKKRYVSITVNSKMLKFAYLDGITYMNFAAVQAYIETVLKCVFTLDWKEHSIVFDCDFKADFYMQSTDYSTNIKAWRNAKGAKIYYSKKLDYLSEKQITGLQFVNRKDASIRCPFVKIYDKHDEMLNRSSDFFDKFFPSETDRLEFYDLKRLEVTVRNKDHFVSLGVEDTSLISILSLSNSTIKEIIKTLLFKHLDSNIPEGETQVLDTPKKLCMPKDYLIVQMINILMKENNFTLRQSLALLDNYPGLNKNTKSNIKRTLKAAFKDVNDFENVINVRVSLKDAFLV